jgi:hypothetical protein
MRKEVACGSRFELRTSQIQSVWGVNTPKIGEAMSQKRGLTVIFGFQRQFIVFICLVNFILVEML